ncbi:MAG TPA: glycosyltransferase family 4 protein [Candidatus Udaeobacter sp.]|nr:glycosyltransferase family 4 protein [Candidatus Udaeobacter sp.]
MKEGKIKIALVRGDSLKEQEAKIWENLDSNLETVAFCGQKNVFSLNNINLAIKRLRSTADNFLTKNYFKYACGQYQRMFGLEKELINFDIAHGVEVYNYYTLQCVRAKKNNPKLKVVANFVDNTFGRFEYNYWPGLNCPPKYWRDKINSIIKENIAGVDKFLAFSKFSAELALDMGAKPEQVEVVYPGLIIEPSDDSLIEKLNLQNVKFDLVISRMIWEKGIYDILYAWKMYLKKSKQTDRKLVVIGDGKEYKNFCRLVSDLGLSSNVLVIKNVPNNEIKQLYKHARAFLLGSTPTRTWQEQFGYSLADAILQNCPVISTTSGAIPEVVGSAGILVPASNPVAFKEALLKLDDEQIYRSLKENSLKEKERFSANVYRKKIIDVYHSLL